MTASTSSLCASNSWLATSFWPPMAAVKVEQGIPGEVVAAISAAVACMEGGRYSLRSVARQRKGRSAWGDAAVAAYTQPF